MKKIFIFLSCALIIGTAQLNAMKRDNSHITTTSEIVQALWLPSELITKIAASCDPETRANWSMTSKSFNAYGSIKNNPAIVDQPEFEINKTNRLYYLFYGCIHNLKNLVNKALQKFDPKKEKKNIWQPNEKYYPDKETLHEAKYQIDQCIKTDACKLLPSYTDIERWGNTYTIFDLAGNNDDVQLFSLCIKSSQFDHLNAMPSCIAYDLSGDPYDFDYLNTDSGFTKERLAILKILLIHNRYSANQLWHYADDESFTLQLWGTRSLTATKLFLDYDKVNDINRRADEGDSWGNALLHIYTNFPNTIRLLLTHPEVDVNIQDKNGRTALHRAAMGDNKLETAKILLAHPEIKVNLKNNYGDTPLHEAINNCYDNENVEMIKLLLADPKTDVNLPNIYRDTPLHLAVKDSNVTHIELLLAHPHIDITMRNDNGKTPLDLAYTLNYERISIINLLCAKKNDQSYTTLNGHIK